MWPLAIIAGIAVNVMAALAADRCSRAGHTVAGRLIQFARWPVFGASIWVAFGLSEHRSAWPLAWPALVVIGGGLLGQAAYLAGYAVYRFRRSAR